MGPKRVLVVNENDLSSGEGGYGIVRIAFRPADSTSARNMVNQIITN